ncbi:MAG: hypothetical protein FWF51_00555 [Chitinivibrionia bacterium]|nr:hypothetical protein [Chitinivibrionia bacterium]
MKIFLGIILFCCAVFANAVQDVSLVSGDDGHIINVKTNLQNPKISYDSKGSDLLIKIESPSIRKQAELSKVKNYDNSFIMSAMATRIEDGVIQILLKGYKLPSKDIPYKQKDDAILFLLQTTNVNPVSTPQKVADANAATISLFVLKNSANLRKSPSMKSELSGKAILGQKFLATNKSGEWYAVKDNGVDCWIHESVVGDSVQFAAFKNPAARMPKDEHGAIVDEYIILMEDTTVMKPLALVIDSTPVVGISKLPTAIPKKIYAYRRKGRDPFLPLDKSDFIREGLPNVNNVTLVGILYDDKDALALFEERVGTDITSFTMRIGDPVVSGKLLRIEPNKVVFLLRESTFSYTVEKELNVN